MMYLAALPSFLLAAPAWAGSQIDLKQSDRTITPLGGGGGLG